MKSTKLVSVLAVAIAFCFASCGNMNKPDNSAAMEKNKEAMRKVNEMWQSGKTDGIENYVAANMIDHMTPTPGITSTGVQALKDMIAMNHAAFPDMKTTVYSLMADGDMVVMHYNMKGTNSGAMGPGMPATNKTMDINGVDIVRFADGKGVEHWGYMEEQKMMTQLGMMPDMSKMNPNPTAANETPAKPEEKK